MGRKSSSKQNKAGKTNKKSNKTSKTNKSTKKSKRWSRFRAQGDSRIRANKIKSFKAGTTAVQSAFKAGNRGWSVGVNGSWSGGNIGDRNSPASKAYRAKHGESAYKSMVKAGGYKPTSATKSWSSIAYGDKPDSYDKIFGEWNENVMNPLGDKVVSGFTNWLKDTAVDTFNAFTDTDRSQQWTPTLTAKEQSWRDMTIGERFKNFDQHPMGDMFKGSFWSKGLSDAKDMGSHALRNIYNPQKNEMAIGHQFAHAATAIPKAWASLVGLAPNISKIPGIKNIPGASRINQQNWAHNVVNATTADHQGLENISNIAQTLQGIRAGVGLMQGGVRNLRGIGTNPFSTTKGFGGWWNKGRNVRVPGESRASFFGKAGLLADDAAQKGVSDAAFKGQEAVSRLTKIIGRPDQAFNPFRSAARGGPWSGPTPAVRQAFERPLRTALGLGGVGLGAARVAAPAGGLAFNNLTSEQGRLRDLMSVLDSDAVYNWSQDVMGEGDWNEMQRNWATNLITQAADPALKQVDDLGGIKGWMAGIQKGKFDRRTAREDVPGTLKNIIGTYSLVDRDWNVLPGAFEEAKERLGNFFNNKDVESIRARLPDRTRREEIRTLRESGYGTGRGSGNNQMRIQSFDPNKINIQANPYGQAATEESDLAAFWQRQSQLDAAADQRLKDIESDKSDYTKLIEQLTAQQQGYTDEFARLKPIGEEISGELERLKPIGKDMAAELERIKPYGKKYSDELERLKEFDEMFRDEFRYNYGWGAKRRGLRPARKGELINKDVLTGREFIQENARWHAGTYRPESTQLLKDYKEYLTGVENLKKWQSEHKEYLSGLETEHKKYKEHLASVEGRQKEYQDYLTGLETEQTNLQGYSAEVGRRSRALDDYSTLFNQARAASDAAARTYTIRSQQGIADSLRSGVSGIRAARGYSTYGNRNRNRSAKRRFNREFRISSFGEGARIQPINI